MGALPEYVIVTLMYHFLAALLLNQPKTALRVLLFVQARPKFSQLSSTLDKLLELLKEAIAQRLKKQRTGWPDSAQQQQQVFDSS
jgi:hypothetical protein